MQLEDLGSEELLLDKYSNNEEDGDGNVDKKKKRQELKKKIADHAAKCLTNIRILTSHVGVQSAQFPRLF